MSVYTLYIHCIYFEKCLSKFFGLASLQGYKQMASSLVTGEGIFKKVTFGDSKYVRPHGHHLVPKELLFQGSHSRSPRAVRDRENPSLNPLK